MTSPQTVDGTSGRQVICCHQTGATRRRALHSVERGLKSSRTSWNAGHPCVSDRDLDYFILDRQRRKFEFEKLRQEQQFEEWKQQMEEERRSAEESEKLSRIDGAWRYRHNNGR